MGFFLNRFTTYLILRDVRINAVRFSRLIVSTIRSYFLSRRFFRSCTTTIPRLYPRGERWRTHRGRSLPRLWRLRASKSPVKRGVSLFSADLKHQLTALTAELNTPWASSESDLQELRYKTAELRGHSGTVRLHAVSQSAQLATLQSRISEVEFGPRDQGRDAPEQ